MLSGQPWATAFFALLLLFGVSPPASASEVPAVAPTVQPTVESERLCALRSALAAGVTDAEAQFWSTVELAGTPLVEPTEDHSGDVRVTFLWKGTATTRSVRLISGPQITSNFKDLGFRRLDDTEVWFLTLHVPRGWRVGYMLVENAEQHGYPENGGWMAAARRDPFNHFNTAQDAADPNAFDRLYSIFDTPGAPPEPWLRRHAGVASGTVITRRLTSARLGTERTVDVYVPSEVSNPGERPAGTVYLFDGVDYLRDMRVAIVLDNLIGEHRVAPLVAVMIHDLPGAGRDRELECDPSFTEFLASELVPWVRRNYAVSADPRRTIVGGFSLGGLEAAYAASVHPELFGAVLSQSGSFWWRPSSLGATDLSVPWMATHYASVGPQQVRFFLSVGRYEAGPQQEGLVNNRRMRDALRASGYELKYEEVEGEHDPLNWRLTLPDGLIYLAPPE